MHIKPAIESDSTEGEIICILKAMKKTKVIRRYMEDLALHTGAPKVYWEEDTSCIYVVEYKRITPGVK